VYVQVRRNFISPMFLAFDYPLPISAAGVRNRSTVPAQALMLLNNEFVLAQAERWAARISQDPGQERVRRMYQEAFGRPPLDWERTEAESYLAQGGTLAGLAHVLINTPEFLYVP
jgi:hypothetical protein